MADKKFAAEFEAHPEAQELFVVNGMPFLTKSIAENFQRGTDHKLEVVMRPAAKAPAAGKMTKDDIIAKLTELNIEHDPSAKKTDLEALLPKE